MGQKSFEELVDELEKRYAGRDRALAWRTMFVVGLGYGGFLLWVLSIAAIGIAACIGALFAPKVLGVILIVVGAIVVSIAIWQAAEVLWLPSEHNRQLLLKSRQAPFLFALLAKLRRELKTPRIHRVELTAQMNAGIRQIPRLGIFGWARNELSLGLPLMELLTLAEFESVLAHEYAHISGQHGRFGAWVYRTRSTWLQLFARVQQPSTSSFTNFARRLLSRFVDWYWPRFHAYFFAMSRSQEYLADQAAANWAGPDDAALALWKINLAAQRLEQRFWPELAREAIASATPPERISSRIREYFATPASKSDLILWSQQAIAAVTDTSDTHPCLADRIVSFGGSLERCQTAGFPQPASPSAADKLFGTWLEEMRRLVDQYWADDVQDKWRARHHRANTLQRRAQEIVQSPDRPEENVAQLWERACAVQDIEGPEAAEPLLRQILAVRPSHPGANLALGQQLLARRQVDGELLLRQMLEKSDSELVPEASQLLAAHYRATGQARKLRQMNEFQGRFQADRVAAQRERTCVTARDTFLPHELADHELEQLRRVLFGDPELSEAFLMRKELKYLAHQRLYVLCVRTRRGIFGRSNATSDQALVDRLISQVKLPGRVLIIAAHGGFRALARKIMGERHAVIEKPESA